MPHGSTFMDIGGRANVVAVVYVPDPVGQLMPCQVAEYALHIRRLSTLKLPLRPNAPTCSPVDGEIGTSSNPNPLLIDITSTAAEADEDDTLDIPNHTQPRQFNIDATFTYPTQTLPTANGRPRTSRRSSMTGCAAIESPLQARTMTHATSARKHRAREVGPSASGRTQSSGAGGEDFDGECGQLACDGTQGCPFTWSDDALEVSDSSDDQFEAILGGIVAHSAMESGAQRGCSTPTLPDEPIHDMEASSGHSAGNSEHVARRMAVRQPRRNYANNGPGEAVDRAETAMEEAEAAFMTADLKYNAAREAQNEAVLDLNEPLNHVNLY